MSTFDDRFAVRLDDIYEMYSETAVYKDNYDTLIDSAVAVIVEHNMQQYTDSGIDIAGAVAVIKVRGSEVTDRPYRDYKFVIGSNIYNVEDVFRSDGIEHAMTVTE
ncbi:MAG: hypothetical protein DRR06_20125 [Gammaproteobacteria bacterium]|nr:MAG: hypothetical protein DRR06_20125 [Gammaproteobacteria bacterium]